MADLQEAGLKLVAEGADAFESTLSGIGGVLDTFGNIAVSAASAAADALGSFFADSFAGALEAEQTVARLGQVIESTGGAAGITVDDAQALADQFKNLAGGSDDAVLAIEEIGLRMGTISADEMPSFIQSTLDLGAVMGDNAKAAQVMARAQEDPVATLGALRKAGVLFSEDQENQIKAMVKAGDTAGAYSLLMDGVGTATGGAAQALADTTAGQWAIFQETVADAGETIVGAFLPALNGILTGLMPLVPIVTEVATVIGNMITDFIDTGGDFGVVADDIREGFAGILPPEVIDAIANAALWFRDELPGIMAAGQTAIQPVIDAATNLANSFLDSMPMIIATVQGMVDFVIAKFNEFAPVIIANVSSTLNSIAEFWTAHGDEIMAVVSVIWEFIVTTVGVAITALTGLVAAGMELLNGDTEGALEILNSTFTTIMDSILSLVGTDLETFIASWTGTFSMVQDIINIGLTAVGNLILGGLESAIAGAQTTLQGFADLGTAIMDGIVSSIQSGAADVLNAMLGVLQDAIDAAQALLGIHSPSRLAMKMIGKPFSEGIAQGILAGMGSVDAAVSITAGAMVRPPMSAGAIGAQYAYSNTDARQFNLNVSTPKPMSSVIGEFATMQTLYGGQI